jgi:hypothetical protein
MAYERINPHAEWRADLRAAQICTLLVNIHRDQKKTQPARTEDFMPKFEKKEEQTPDQYFAWAKAMFAPKEDQKENV